MWSCNIWRSVLNSPLFSLCLSGIWHCYWEYSMLSRAQYANMTFSDIHLHTDFSVYLHLSQTWLIFSMLSATALPLLHNYLLLSVMLHSTCELVSIQFGILCICRIFCSVRYWNSRWLKQFKFSLDILIFICCKCISVI